MKRTAFIIPASTLLLLSLSSAFATHHAIMIAQQEGVCQDITDVKRGDL